MTKKSGIVRYMDDQIAAMLANGESRTDRARADALSSAEIEASIKADPDEASLAVDWENATIRMPEPKAVLNMRVDADVLDFFKRTGRGYQTRINAVLKAFVAAQQRGGMG